MGYNALGLMPCAARSLPTSGLRKANREPWHTQTYLYLNKEYALQRRFTRARTGLTYPNGAQQLNKTTKK